MILPKMLPLKVLIWVNKHPFWKYKHLTEELRMYLLLVETVTNFIFLDSKITALDDCSHKTKRCSLLGRKAMTNLDRVLKSRDMTLPAKVHLGKAMFLQQSCMGVRAGPKEGWALKNWRFGTVVLEKTLASPLDCKEIKLVNPKGNQPWIFIGRTDAEAEAAILLAI